MIEKKITNYFKNKEDIIAVYLFGSYATGNARSFSDIDLAILFDTRDRSIVNQRLDKYLIDLSRILRKDMHLTAMNFASEALLKQIFKKGHCLMVNDSKKLAYFTMTAYAKIVNFHYYRDQFQAGIVRKVMEGI
jgi:predicted nucleotidyltransferase